MQESQSQGRYFEAVISETTACSPSKDSEEYKESGEENSRGIRSNKCILYSLNNSEGKKIEIETTFTGAGIEREFKTGDRVLVQKIESNNQPPQYNIVDYSRKTPMLALMFFFVLLVVAISKIRGVGSLLGLFLSILILFAATIPLILNGVAPVIVILITILPVTVISVFLSHGFNMRSTIATGGIFLSLALTYLLGLITIHFFHLTGSSEESAMLANTTQQDLHLTGILSASFLISAIGLLDDVTVSQIGSVIEIYKANRKISWRNLYNSAMNVGRDHIASMVNTLVLAYVGASMPMVLLFYSMKTPLQRILSYEPIAEEIARTLIGSIGLVFAVPVTTALASYLVKKSKKKDSWIK